MQEEGRKKRLCNYNLPLASHVLFKTSLHPKSPAWQAVQSDSRTASAHAWASQAAFAASTGPQRPLNLSPPPSLPHQILHHLCRGMYSWMCIWSIGTNAGARLCHSSLNLDLLLFSPAVTLFVSLSLFPSHSFPLILSHRIECLSSVS